MLQIRLNKGSTTDGGTGSKPLPVETVTVACPDHLVLADLPVAKSIGSATAASHIKVVGRRSRRQLGERVHFCVHCDFPIAIYGRLSPCEHAFCLDCARSDSICYLCDERIQKIQTIKMMEGIFICAAPHCLKSFLNKTEFEAHIHENHANLLQPNTRKEEMNESEPFGAKQYSAPDSSLGPPPRSGFLPSSNPQSNEREDRARRQQPREPPPSRPVMQPKLPPYYGQTPNHLPDSPADNGLATPNHPHQLSFDTQGGVQQDFNQFSDKQQQEILSEPPHHDYPPLYFQPPPNFPMPSIPNPVLPNPPPPIGFPPFPSNGAPPFYTGPLPYEVSHSEAAVDQGSFLGFPSFPAAPVNFQQSYPRTGSGAPTISAAFDAVQCGQGMIDGDHQGRLPFYQGDYGRNSSNLPPLNPLPLPLSSKAMEQMQAANGMDAKVMLAQKPMPPPPPPPGPPPAHLLQQKLGNYAPGDSSRDGNNYR